jgi:hypothetical protein
MKKIIYQRLSTEGDRRKRIEDLRDSLPDFLGQGWKVLQTPIVLDVDLIDILLVNADGQLSLAKVLDDEETISFFGKMVLDYSVLNEKRDKLKNAYADVYIDGTKNLKVFLFVPSKNASFLSAINQVDFAITLYTYMFVKSQEHEGIVLDRIDVNPKQGTKIDPYDSMLKIMGENVRSEHSQYTVDSIQSPVPSESRVESLHSVSKQPLSQHDFESKRVSDFLDKTTLTEEELIAFFDLEKKVDSYCNIMRNNSGK